MKLVINSLGAHLMSGFASAMSLAVALGLDARTTLEAIQSGGFSSPVFAHRGPKVLARDFSPDFTLRLMLKDQRLALDQGLRAPGGDRGERILTAAPTSPLASRGRVA
jgi:3-hydroxyisobutyrate dehydrogenase-like beta-hydroxyacid dehydrogenase